MSSKFSIEIEDSPGFGKDGATDLGHRDKSTKKTDNIRKSLRNALYSAEGGIFSLIYAMEAQNTLARSKKIAYIGLILDYLQVFAFAVSKDFGWSAVVSIVASWMQINATYFGFEVYEVLFIVTVLFLFMTVILAVYTVWMFSHNDVKLWPLRILRSVSMFMVTIGFIPISKIIFAVHNCASTTATNAFFLAFSNELLSCSHLIIHKIVSVMSLAIFVPFCLLVGVLYFDPNPKSELPFARRNARVDGLYIFFKSILVLFDVIGDVQKDTVWIVIQLVALDAVFAIMFLAMIADIPYHKPLANRLKAGVFFSVLATSLFTTVLYATNTLVTTTTPIMWFGIAIGVAIVGFLCGAALMQLRMMPFLTLRRSSSTAAETPISSRFTGSARHKPPIPPRPVHGFSPSQSRDFKPLTSKGSQASATDFELEVSRRSHSFSSNAGSGVSRRESKDGFQRQLQPQEQPVRQSQSHPADPWYQRIWPFRAVHTRHTNAQFGGQMLCLHSTSSSTSRFGFRKRSSSIGRIDAGDTHMILADVLRERIHACGDAHRDRDRDRGHSHEKYGKCTAFMLLTYGQFVLAYFPERWAEVAVLLRKVRQLKPGFEDRWLIHHLAKDLEQAQPSAGFRGSLSGRLDLMSYVEIQRHTTHAARYQERVLKAMVKFWELQLHPDPDMKQLLRLVNRIDVNDHNANESFKAALKAKPDDPEIWRAYAVYVEQVVGDTRRGQAILNHADDVEQSNVADADAMLPNVSSSIVNKSKRRPDSTLQLARRSGSVDDRDVGVFSSSGHNQTRRGSQQYQGGKRGRKYVRDSEGNALVRGPSSSSDIELGPMKPKRDDASSIHDSDTDGGGLGTDGTGTDGDGDGDGETQTYKGEDVAKLENVRSKYSVRIDKLGGKNSVLKLQKVTIRSFVLTLFAVWISVALVYASLVLSEAISKDFAKASDTRTQLSNSPYRAREYVESCQDHNVLLGECKALNSQMKAFATAFQQNTTFLHKTITKSSTKREYWQHTTIDLLFPAKYASVTSPQVPPADSTRHTTHSASLLASFEYFSSETSSLTTVNPGPSSLDIHFGFIGLNAESVYQGYNGVTHQLMSSMNQSFSNTTIVMGVYTGLLVLGLINVALWLFFPAFKKVQNNRIDVLCLFHHIPHRDIASILHRLRETMHTVVGDDGHDISSFGIDMGGGDSVLDGDGEGNTNEQIARDVRRVTKSSDRKYLAQYGLAMMIVILSLFLVYGLEAVFMNRLMHYPAESDIALQIGDEVALIRGLAQELVINDLGVQTPRVLKQQIDYHLDKAALLHRSMVYGNQSMSEYDMSGIYYSSNDAQKAILDLQIKPNLQQFTRYCRYLIGSNITLYNGNVSASSDYVQLVSLSSTLIHDLTSVSLFIQDNLRVARENVIILAVVFTILAVIVVMCAIYLTRKISRRLLADASRTGRMLLMIPKDTQEKVKEIREFLGVTAQVASPIMRKIMFLSSQVSIALSIGDHAAAARDLSKLGQLLMTTGKHEEALSSFEKCLSSLKQATNMDAVELQYIQESVNKMMIQSTVKTNGNGNGEAAFELAIKYWEADEKHRSHRLDPTGVAISNALSNLTFSGVVNLAAELQSNLVVYLPWSEIKCASESESNGNGNTDNRRLQLLGSSSRGIDVHDHDDGIDSVQDVLYIWVFSGNSEVNQLRSESVKVTFSRQELPSGTTLVSLISALRGRMGLGLEHRSQFTMSRHNSEESLSGSDVEEKADFGKSVGDSLSDLLDSAYRLMISPVEDEIMASGMRLAGNLPPSVIFCPDGILHAVPFGLLHASQTSDKQSQSQSQSSIPLVKRVNMSIVPCLHSLQSLVISTKNRSRITPVPSASEVSVFAGPMPCDYPYYEGMKESYEIAKALKRVKVGDSSRLTCTTHTGATVTKKNVIAWLNATPPPRFVHFAANVVLSRHDDGDGGSQSNGNSESGSGSESESESNRNGNGGERKEKEKSDSHGQREAYVALAGGDRLTESQIRLMDLSGISLVSFTAVDYRVHSDLYVYNSFALALLEAGVTSVLMPAWNGSVNVTKSIISHFYHSLGQDQGEDEDETEAASARYLNTAMHDSSAANAEATTLFDTSGFQVYGVPRRGSYKSMKRLTSQKSVRMLSQTDSRSSGSRITAIESNDDDDVYVI